MFIETSTACFNGALNNLDMFQTTKRLFDALLIATNGKVDGFENPGEAAKALDQSPATITNWKTRGVSKEGLLKANQLFGINPDWLAREEGPMFIRQVDQGAAVPKIAEPTPIYLEQNPQYPSVRRVRFKLSAGASGFGVEYRDDDGAPIVFQREWFENNGYRPEALFAVKVANGSMEPGLFDGDTVVVNTAQTEPRDGRVFAVNYEGELVIKRLVRDAGEWWLCSDNPDQRRHPRKRAHDGAILIGEIVHKQSERI